MTFKSLTLTAALALLPMTAGAATSIFTTVEGFNAALDGRATITEDFSGYDAPTQLGGPSAPTGFMTGTTVAVNNPSSDNLVENDALSLSIDNVNGPQSATEVVLSLPNATRFASLFFGDGNGNRGIGNNSGTILLSNADGETEIRNFSNDRNAQFTGFFGFGTDSAFDTITFRSGGVGSFTDDDFRVDDLTFVAPVPVPAALPLLALGLGGLAAMRRRKG